MIYSASFDNIETIPDKYRLLSVSLMFPPSRGIEPMGELYSRNGIDDHLNNGLIGPSEYRRRYLEQLYILDASLIADRLRGCVIMSHERAGEMGPRRVISEWLTSHGYRCEEI